jgi:hypothetical protein
MWLGLAEGYEREFYRFGRRLPQLSIVSLSPLRGLVLTSLRRPAPDVVRHLKETVSGTYETDVYRLAYLFGTAILICLGSA